jgi:hypothetical protein
MNALLADYAVKIFKGAKPADLPVQQSARIGAGGRGDRDLDRGHGKPTQHIDADHSGSIAHQISLMTPAERARDALELTERARPQDRRIYADHRA